MSEAVLLICTIAIVAPILVLVVIGYNINQKLKGLPEKDGADALIDVWKNLLKKFQTPNSNTQAKGISKTTTKFKNTNTRSSVEDAEFYEKKS